MKNGKVYAVLLLVMVLLLAIPVVAAAERQGVSFSAEERYESVKEITEVPYTLEAWIRFPANAKGRGGVIWGSYPSAKECVDLEILTGTPRVLWRDSEGKVTYWSFTSVKVYTGEWVHLAIVRDVPNSKVHCYVNGELAESVDMVNAKDVVPKGTFVLGGDMRDNNAQSFKGEISSVSLFSKARSASQIAQDMKKPEGEGLFLHYELSDGELADGRVTDLSGNGYDVALPQKEVEPPAVSQDHEGITFIADKRYESEKDLTEVPNTFEAWIRFPAGMSGRGGIIWGNYPGSQGAVNFEILNGTPRMLWRGTKTGATYWNFTSTKVYTGEWVHLAIVRDVTNGKVHCYLNGVLSESVDIVSTEDIIPDKHFVLGGDMRDENSVFFKGEIATLAIFSDVRSADQIIADMTKPEGGTLLVHYELADEDPADGIADQSGNGYDLYPAGTLTWIPPSQIEPVANSAYSFAVIGDTQIINDRNPDQFPKIYDWIIDQVEAKNIRFVMGLGDITDFNADAEWERAHTAITKMNGLVPYSTARGNHDSVAKFNQYFSYEEFGSSAAGTYQNSMQNAYYTLRIGELDYLFLTLDFSPTDAMMAWASNVIAAHPNHNVIVTTHCYLYRDGTTISKGDQSCPTTGTNGDDIWEKLIRKHENIVLVISGHDPCAEIILSEAQGDKGNIVKQLLIDPQGVDGTMESKGGAGLVALLHFSEDGKTVTVEYYSPVQQAYYKEENQFSFTVQTIAAAPETTETQSPTTGTDETGSSETTDSTSQPNNPSTNDLFMYILVSVLALAVAVVGVIILRKKNSIA